MKKLAYDVVCLSAAALLWAHGAPAAEVSLAIAPTNWVTCAPVVTATFAAGLDVVVLEWAPGDAGAFTQIATCPDPSAETWTVELPGTVVGQPRRYRLAMTSGGSTSYSDPVAFTRFRNLDRNPRDRSALATGVYPVLSADSNSMKPFNAYTGDWADSADAILTAYLPGQEGARVLAGIMTGAINPSGKLNQSWPARPEDTPLTDTPEHAVERSIGVPFGEDDTLIRMTEGIFTGYRWYDRAGVKPLFPFGHGLSYTRFEYSDLRISAARDEDGLSRFTVRCSVTNTGDRTGDEIVQLYLGRAEVPGYIQMAEKQLVGYVRLKDLKPGETREAEMQIDPRMLCYWDPAMLLQARPDGTRDKWVRARGKRAVYVAASSADIRLTGGIDVD